MASVKHGTLARPGTWHRHMDWMKRLFWKRERVAQAKAAEAALESDSEPPSRGCDPDDDLSAYEQYHGI